MTLHARFIATLPYALLSCAFSWLLLPLLAANAVLKSQLSPPAKSALGAVADTWSAAQHVDINPKLIVAVILGAFVIGFSFLRYALIFAAHDPSADWKTVGQRALLHWRRLVCYDVSFVAVVGVLLCSAFALPRLIERTWAYFYPRTSDILIWLWVATITLTVFYLNGVRDLTLSVLIGRQTGRRAPVRLAMQHMRSYRLLGVHALRGVASFVSGVLALYFAHQTYQEDVQSTVYQSAVHVFSLFQYLITALWLSTLAQMNAKTTHDTIATADV